jgi:uncharacterized protein YneF (UPF0154 family)
MDIVLIVLALAGTVALGYFTRPTTYGSDLERYIISKRPQNAGDIDRLTFEYNQKMSDERII